MNKSLILATALATGFAISAQAADAGATVVAPQPVVLQPTVDLPAATPASPAASSSPAASTTKTTGKSTKKTTPKPKKKPAPK